MSSTQKEREAIANGSSIMANSDVFPTKEFDVSVNFCLWVATFPILCGALAYRTTVVLEQEEAVKTDTNLYGTTISRRPYGELGSVDKSNCLCCVSVVSDLGGISPGCGCEEAMVDQLVADLKERMRQRGDTAQIRRAEETLNRLDDIENKLNAIISHLKIPQSEIMGREDA